MVRLFCLFLLAANFVPSTICSAAEFIQQQTKEQCDARGGRITQWMSSFDVVPARGTCRVDPAAEPTPQVQSRRSCDPFNTAYLKAEKLLDTRAGASTGRLCRISKEVIQSLEQSLRYLPCEHFEKDDHSSVIRTMIEDQQRDADLYCNISIAAPKPPESPTRVDPPVRQPTPPAAAEPNRSGGLDNSSEDRTIEMLKGRIAVLTNMRNAIRSMSEGADKEAAKATFNELLAAAVTRPQSSSHAWKDYDRQKPKAGSDCPNQFYALQNQKVVAVCEYFTIGHIENRRAIRPDETPEELKHLWRTGRQIYFTGRGCGPGFDGQSAMASARMEAKVDSEREARKEFQTGDFRFDADTSTYDCRVLSGE